MQLITCEKSCRIILVRHGQTQWNNDYKFQGMTDTSLDDEGIKQAEKLAIRLSTWPPEVIYTSPLKRAYTTAEAISRQFDIQPTVMPELEEVNFGSWEGASIHNIERDTPEIFSRWRADPFFNPPEGGESWPEISSRLTRAVNTMLASNHERIVAVTHGGVIRALFAVILGVDPHKAWNVEVSNCAITGIEFRGGMARLHFANDDMHIRGGENGVKMPLWGERYEP
ncbi:MAG: histidine phosphatase family protein [Synergistaceae bacterium]|nr:histidine phosphatase family protein [Synergistaceae bacterium]